MGKIKNKRIDIQLLRLLSTAMIVICHIITFYKFIPGSQFLNQVFDVGVFVFLLISGYLYGSKTITDFKKWMIQRALRICIPVLIVVSVTILIFTFCYDQHFGLATILFYIFNLQGLLALNSTFFSHFFDQIASLGALWFTTVIMLCYFMVPFLQKIKKTKLRVRITLVAISAIVSGIIKFFTGTELMYFVTFALGYLLADIGVGETKVSKARLFVFAVLTFAFQVVRLLLLVIVDNSPVYLAFVPFSHLLLGAFIFIFVIEIYKKFSVFFDKICETKFFAKLDKLSFYTYLTHGIFCMGVINVYELFSNLWVSTIVFGVLTLAASAILCFADDSINTFIKRKCK